MYLTCLGGVLCILIFRSRLFYFSHLWWKSHHQDCRSCVQAGKLTCATNCFSPRHYTKTLNKPTSNKIKGLIV